MAGAIAFTIEARAARAIATTSQIKGLKRSFPGFLVLLDVRASIADADTVFVRVNFDF